MSSPVRFSTPRRLHWALHLVLALVVLLGQVTLARHSLQHVKQGDDGLDTVCVECLALHALDHAGTAPATPVVAAPQTVPASPVLAPVAREHTAPALHYDSRAPPARSA